MRIRAALSFSPKHPRMAASHEPGAQSAAWCAVWSAPFRSQIWAELQKDARVRTNNDMQTNEGPVKGGKKHMHTNNCVPFPFSFPSFCFLFFFPRGVHNPDSPRYSIPSAAPICAAGSGLRIMQSSTGGRCTPASNFPGVRGVWPDDRRLSTPSAAGGPCRAPR